MAEKIPETAGEVYEAASRLVEEFQDELKRLLVHAEDLFIEAEIEHARVLKTEPDEDSPEWIALSKRFGKREDAANMVEALLRACKSASGKERLDERKTYEETEAEDPKPSGEVQSFTVTFQARTWEKAKDFVPLAVTVLASTSVGAVVAARQTIETADRATGTVARHLTLDDVQSLASEEGRSDAIG